MHIEINYRDIHKTDAIEEHIRSEVEGALKHISDRITRVEVHVGDERPSEDVPDDKRCMLEARPRGMDPIAVEVLADDLYTAVSEAAGKLQRALTRRFEKSGDAR